MEKKPNGKIRYLPNSGGLFAGRYVCQLSQFNAIKNSIVDLSSSGKFFWRLCYLLWTITLDSSKYQ